jgi:stage II sporulation protein R
LNTSIILVNTQNNGGIFMKKYTFYLIGVLLLYSIVFCFFCYQDSKKTADSLSDKILRFHVIANSDSEKDQSRKLQLKSYLVETLRPYMQEFTDSKTASTWIYQHLSFIQSLSENYLKEPVNVTYGTCAFPIKTYGNYTFPSGSYKALEVRIGKALGKNWWCVLYPSLCFTDETSATFPKTSSEKLKDSLSPKEYQEISEPIQFRWKIAEFINSVIS